jgi:uncharacterized repeat protein (TIGR01451 family)
MSRRLLVWVVVAASWAIAIPVSASGAEPAPGFRVESIPEPTNFSANDGGCEGSCDSYLIVVTNSGGRVTDGSPITVTDTLPAGVTAEAATLSGPPGQVKNTSLPCDISSPPTVTCTFEGRVLGPDEVLKVLIWIGISDSTPRTITNSIAVSGGGAKPVLESAQNTISTAPASPGLDGFDLELNSANGGIDTQAGDHPFGITSTFDFASVITSAPKHPPPYGPLKEHYGVEERGELYVPVQEVKDVYVDLPVGFAGDPQDAAQCTEAQLQIIQNETGEPECPPDSQVGVIQLDESGTIETSPNLSGGTFISGIYNIVPEHGYPAEFGFHFLNEAVIIYATVVPSSQGYVLRVYTPGILRFLALNNISLTFWGVPEDSSHNLMRVNQGLEPVGFLTNPTDCSAGPLSSTAFSDTWEDPGSYLPDGQPDLSDPAWVQRTTTVYPSITGCELLQFTPTLSVLPSTSQADEPTGLSVDLGVPQAPQIPPYLMTPPVKDVSVTLPSGVSLSPSAGDGLQACSEEQIGLSSTSAGSCPDGSVLGTVQITTPLLAMPLEGHVYLGTPGCGQPGQGACSDADAADGNMFRLYIEAGGSGVVVKVPGKAFVNTSTGQITSTFAEDPQLPFSDLKVDFKGGLRAPLATPQSCGVFTTTSDFTPWSSPITPDATPSSSFNVDWNGDGGACPVVPGLDPVFSAGTSNPNAGQFSPLTITFSREDREQDLSGIQVKTPPGLLGSLTGVPLCGEPEASLGTCSSSSRIGSMTVAAGPGSHPFYAQGSLYLTGPYRGAPFGLSIVVPTVAGPFNLGNVVVRARINVDPNTAALTVTSDPLPQIIDGIPLRLRTANVTVDRPGFIFNPTNCAQQQIAATIAGAQGAQAQVSVPFAVAGCSGLPFAPKFTASTSGHTSRADGASLDAKLVYPTGASSNIAKVKVDLPRQLPSRLSTLQKACPAATFDMNPASCPKGSVVGIARATTPVLPVPLSGPAYFVSHGGEAFPNLIVVLQGYGVRIDLIGDTYISKTGVTSSTFTNVPDVQVNTFELYLPEGPGSALAANGNLCKTKLVMPTSFIAQDGAQLKQNTKITVTGCPSAKTAHKTTKAHKARRAGRTVRRAAGRRGGQGRSR